ncbi:MAG: hypothetical protein M3N28_09035 [Actinomycetota bacterium]|nr:hypothetical protein [Actinomycetota bacterium]
MIGFLAGLLAAALVMGVLLLAAGGILYVMGLLAGGLVVGALGGAVVPGPNRAGVGTTMLLGLGGSFLGGFAGWFALGDGGPLWGLFLSLAGAAFVVWLVKNQDRAPASQPPCSRGSSGAD